MMRKKKMLRFLGVVAVLATVLFFYVFASSYVRIDRLDGEFDPKYGWPVDARQRRFDLDFPSRERIESYLSDVTILFSSEKNNEVIYFDADHHFLRWGEDKVWSGRWSIHPELRIRILNSRWRWDVVQIFCYRISGIDSEAQQDNCWALLSVDSVFSQIPGKRDYRKGNVFSLEKNWDTKPLPAGKMSIDSLLVRLNSEAGAWDMK